MLELPPLTHGKILRRYKRFFVDVELDDGQTVVAHCANTGAMTSCWQHGARVALSYNDNPRRKLRWSLERVDMGQGWIGVNTMRTNPLIAELVRQHKIPMLTGYQRIKTEPVYQTPEHPRARFDLLLTADDKPACYVEIKNTTLWLDQRIQFPDAVTVRGRKHLELLIDAVHQGNRAVMLFAVNRPEGDRVYPANEIDPQYAATLKHAVDQGVEARAVRIHHTSTGMEMAGELTVLV